MLKRNHLLAAAATILLAGAGLWWWNGQRGDDAPAPAAAAAKAPGGLLAVDPAHAKQLGIEAQPAETAAEMPLATIPAQIQPPANARVAVAATFPGVVLRTLVVEGDAVRQGQPLAVISSRDVLTMGAERKRAAARMGVARSNAARLGQLSREGIIAAARADEADAALAEAEADFSEKSRILNAVHADGTAGTYTLVAPIAGRVTAAAIHAGDPLDGTTAPFVVDAAHRYEVAGQLPGRLVGAVRPGMVARVGEVRGQVTAVGTTIDPETRSASLKAAVPAGPGLISGGATSVTILGSAPSGAVSLPVAAVTTLDGKTVVFVEREGGFSVRDVKVAAADRGTVVVLSGLSSGERVAISGVSALKSLALGQ